MGQDTGDIYDLGELRSENEALKQQLASGAGGGGALLRNNSEMSTIYARPRPARAAAYHAHVALI